MTTIELSGYSDSKELLAQQYMRAGKPLYIVAMPLHLIPTHLPIPDPEHKEEGNRTVDRRHATAFGKYWRENEKWATPPLLLDTLYPLNEVFEPRFEVAEVKVGVLHLPAESQEELSILDGQHRILGWTTAAREVHSELKKARDALVTAQDRGKADAAHAAEEEVEALKKLQTRFREEYITVEILEGVTMADHKQYFHDIAQNAKGITKSLTASFDRRHLVNRVAVAVAESHSLLSGKVDFEKPNATGQNPNFVSGRNLVDIISALAVGIGASVTPAKERRLTEESMISVTTSYFDALLSTMPDLRAVLDGEMTPPDLRVSSMIGSPTILRMLAGAFHGLAVEEVLPQGRRVSAAGEQRARALFVALAESFRLPLDERWYATGYFPEQTSRAPLSNAQTLKAMSLTMMEWGRTGRPFA